MTQFKITGPGLYKTRSGEKAIVEVEGNYSYKGHIYQWKGRIGDNGKTWNEYGTYCIGQLNEEDIIGPWEEPATVITVLEYKGITKKPSDVLTWFEFVQIMHTLNDPALAVCSSTKGESRSEDEAHGNTACSEAGSALKDAISVITSCFGVGGHILACHIADELKANGYTIVPTSILRDNRNGVYNTRTDKETD